MSNYSDFILYDVAKLEDLVQKGVAEADIIDLLNNAKLNNKEKVLISVNELDNMLEKSINIDLPRKQIDEDNLDVIRCPKCKSQHIFTTQKGYNIVKGIIGGLFLGKIGTLWGYRGSKQLLNYCKKCGHKW